MHIREKSIVIFHHNNKFLFTVCKEETTGNTFYIPVGGGIEFGETSLAAAKREVIEEIGQETENEKLIDISENIFIYNGKQEHEIVFTYLADFKNRSAYTSALQTGLNDNGNQIQLTWKSIEEISSNNISVYPAHLMDILENIRENF